MSDSLMPQVSFHFNVPNKQDYACRFIRKALRHDAHVTVVAPVERLQQLSSKLWKWGRHEFLAHATQGDDSLLLALSPVTLVESAAFSPQREVLLNLGEEVPQDFEQFRKVVEIVSSFDEHDKAQARTRWRQYQHVGAAIERFDVIVKGSV